MTTPPRVLTVGIGDIKVALMSLEPDLHPQVARTTERFLSNPTNVDVVVRARWGELREPASGHTTFESGGVWKLYEDRSNYLFRFTSPAFGSLPYKQACFCSDFTSGEVVLHREYFDHRQPIDVLEYPLDELLIVNLLSRGRGVEVHACGVEDSDGRGYLFVGHSGAGKSTTARLWQQAAPGIRVLSDDRIILRSAEGRIWMYGTPWHGEAALACSTRTPLSHIFFLGRGNNQVVSVRRPEAVALLMACSFLPFYHAAALDYALAFLEHVTRVIPFGELRFAVDDRVPEFVREYVDEYRSSIQAVC